MLAVLLVAALSLAPLVAEPRAVAPFDHVVVISVDGLRPDILEGPSLASLPNFARLLRGPHTLNARTDSQHTNTLPNHISMATGRPVHGPYGHCWTGNTDPPSAAAGGTLHINKGAYITSMFDVAHDAGLSTALATTKTKFWIFEQSYCWAAGAPDTTPPDNGNAKIDFVTFSEQTRELAGAVADRLRRASTRTLDFVHLAAPDVAGHGYDWTLAPGSPYVASVGEVDRALGTLFQAIDADAELRGHTAIILTSDHGGGVPRKTHTDITCPLNFRIPFIVWLGDQAASTDLYAINPTRARLESEQIGERDAEFQPIRNGDAANAALQLLGLPTIAGSFYGVKAPLQIVAP